MTPDMILAACPFCGGEATMRLDHDHSTAWIVECMTKPSCPIHDREIYGLTKCAAITAWNRRPSPQGDVVTVPRELVLAVEDAINEPPRIYNIEPMEVRDYRHSLYRIWEPLCRAILALSAAPASPASERNAGEVEKLRFWLSSFAGSSVMMEVCEPTPGNPSANIFPISREALLSALSDAHTLANGGEVQPTSEATAQRCICALYEKHMDTCPVHGLPADPEQSTASGTPAAMSREAIISTLKAAGGLHNPEENAPIIADAILALTAPAVPMGEAK